MARALLIGIACWSVARAWADESPQLAAIELREYLVLPAVGNYGRLPMHQDVVEAQIVAGTWMIPQEGDPVEAPGGLTKSWQSAQADAGVAVNSLAPILDTRALRGGYALARFESPVEQVMLLNASGHAAVYVNGELRTGDPYGTGWVQLPVIVRAGENTLLFHVAGDQLSASLSLPAESVFLMGEDAIVPTLVRGEVDAVWGAVNVVNATREWLRDAQLFCSVEHGGKTTTSVPQIPPLSVRKVAFQIPPGGRDQADTADCRIELVGSGDKPILSTVNLSVLQVDAAEPHLRTFRSRIDGSVQPYAVRPAAKQEADDEPALPGMIVTLHDAGVDCAAQLERFSAKPWAHVIAPQGRRPYGFDWEEWGRIDVLEALEDARRRYPTAPGRTYVTGRGMGGHGAWHLGVTRPDEFAAIGPNNGWASFWSYGGGLPAFEQPTKLESLILRSYAPSDTMEMLTNLSDVGVYVLHDANDETVPVTQARFMRNRLAGFHPNFAYFENPQSGSWPLEDNCDWPPMNEFFERLRRPSALERTTIDFTTADPGVSSRSDWLSIEAQQVLLKPSRALVRQDVDGRAFVGQTTNVARLAIDVEHLLPWQPIDVTVDGQQMQWIPWPDEYRLWFERKGDQWKPVDAPSPRLKGPKRNGTFKSAFNHGALLVYGTVGSEEENRWAEGKARYDAETFWYRGGGSLEVLPDTEFDAAKSIGRNVILYGNADTNTAWSSLLSSSPVQIKRGEVRVGDRREVGDDLAVLMVLPQADDDASVVGVVAGTGPGGCAVTNRLRYFVSGIAYPDFMLVGADGLTTGSAGIRAWGHFGTDWAIDSGEIAWRTDK